MNYGQTQTAPGGLRYTGENDIRNHIGAVPQENRQLPIHGQLEDLEHKLRRLHETIEILNQRLSCVSAPQPPLKDSEVSHHPGGSGMSVQITGLVAMVDGAGNKLRLMLDALEI